MNSFAVHAILVVFLTICARGALVNGQKPTPGLCPAVSASKVNGTNSSFDLKKYSGIWYELERTMNVFELGLRCVTANYTLKSDGTVSVVNQGISKWGQKISIDGSARVPNAAVPNDLRVTFKFSPEAPYWIADTDYTDYAIVISCTNVLGLFRVESMWILGRNNTLPESTINVLHSYIDRLGFDSTALKVVDQTKCSK